MRNGATLLVDALENEGVDRIFGVPGEENLDFLESLRNSSIELVLTRHEQGAGFMAATYGRHTGKTGVCLATLGPGATNFVTAAASPLCRPAARRSQYSSSQHSDPAAGISQCSSNSVTAALNNCNNTRPAAARNCTVGLSAA